MAPPSETAEESKPRHPLLSISLIVALMLILPALLYTIAPAGPVREGEVVYANGKQRAYFVEPGRYRQAGYGNACILEPRDALVVVQTPVARLDGALRVRFEGKTIIEFPFCPPHAEVLIKPHQVVQRASPWQELTDSLARFLRPSPG